MRKWPRIGNSVRVEMQMTAMIDVVFQLLIFFMLSFKIVALEGELRVQPPDDGRSAAPLVHDSLPLRLRLSADETGELAQILLNDQPFGDWDELRHYIKQLVGADGYVAGSSAEWEVVVDSDERLRYAHVVAAITAVSGFVDERGHVVPLVQNIQFGARR